MANLNVLLVFRCRCNTTSLCFSPTITWRLSIPVPSCRAVSVFQYCHEYRLCNSVPLTCLLWISVPSWHTVSVFQYCRDEPSLDLSTVVTYRLCISVLPWRLLRDGRQRGERLRSHLVRLERLLHERHPGAARVDRPAGRHGEGRHQEVSGAMPQDGGWTAIGCQGIFLQLSKEWRKLYMQFIIFTLV